LRFFKGISAINDTLVKEHLAQLKASGDYARIAQKEVTISDNAYPLHPRFEISHSNQNNA